MARWHHARGAVRYGARMSDASGSQDSDGEYVTVERHSDGVAIVRLDRPKANALSVSVLGRLESVVAELAADPPGSVVLWGGPRLFAAGADVSEFTQRGIAQRVTDAFLHTTLAIAEFPRVTIAAITGYALGGGLELALACDLRVAADDARLGQPEILLGIIPGGGATQRLPRLIGTGRARDLVLTGRQVGAAEALQMGLVDRVVPSSRVLEESLDLARGLAAGALVAQSEAKRVIDQGVEMPLVDGLRLEASAFVSLFDTEDARGGIASFLEHGPGHARFVGH